MPEKWSVVGFLAVWLALPQGLGSMGIEWQDYLEIGAWLNRLFMRSLDYHCEVTGMYTTSVRMEYCAALSGSQIIDTLSHLHRSVVAPRAYQAA